MGGRLGQVGQTQVAVLGVVGAGVPLARLGPHQGLDELPDLGERRQAGGQAVAVLHVAEDRVVGVHLPGLHQALVRHGPHGQLEQHADHRVRRGDQAGLDAPLHALGGQA